MDVSGFDASHTTFLRACLYKATAGKIVFIRAFVKSLCVCDALIDISNCLDVEVSQDCTIR